VRSYSGPAGLGLTPQLNWSPACATPTRTALRRRDRDLNPFGSAPLHRRRRLRARATRASSRIAVTDTRIADKKLVRRAGLISNPTTRP